MREIEGMHGNEMMIIEFIPYGILKTFHVKYRGKDKEINNPLNLGFPK